MSLSAALDKTLTHRAAVTTKDGFAGDTYTFPSVTNADVPCAVWEPASTTTRDLKRDDRLNTVSIVTAQNLGAVSGDQFTISSINYIVDGIQVFSNAAVTSEVLYLHTCTKRTVA